MKASPRAGPPRHREADREASPCIWPRPHVSLVALPDAVVSTLAGIYDVLNGAAMLGLTSSPTFAVEVVGEEAGLMRLASGVPFEVQRSIDDIESTDIVIVPSILLDAGTWQKGRYAKLVP